MQNVFQNMFKSISKFVQNVFQKFPYIKSKFRLTMHSFSVNILSHLKLFLKQYFRKYSNVLFRQEVCNG